MTVQITNIEAPCVFSSMRKRSAAPEKVTHHPTFTERRFWFGAVIIEPLNACGFQLARDKIGRITPVFFVFRSFCRSAVFVVLEAPVNVRNAPLFTVFHCVDHGIGITFRNEIRVTGELLQKLGLRTVTDFKQGGLIRF